MDNLSGEGVSAMTNDSTQRVISGLIEPVKSMTQTASFEIANLLTETSSRQCTICKAVTVPGQNQRVAARGCLARQWHKVKVS